MKTAVICDSNNCDSAARYSVEFKGGASGPPSLWCTRCTQRYFRTRQMAGLWELLSRENFGDPIFTVSIKKFKQPEKKR